jgi:Flp pilus assembly protein TadG
MWNRLLHLRHDETGMSFVFIGAGFMAFLTATTLAIDVGMFMTARSQSQNAADAGALAGATSLAFDSFTDHSATGPAVSSALSTSRANLVMAGKVSVAPADVEFLVGPNGTQNRVKVSVYRDAAHNNDQGQPNTIPTLMGPLFGVPQFGIWATATAEASPADAVTCVKPFMIPDRWIEHTDPVWDPNTSTFDLYNNKGVMLSPHDVYNGDLNSPDYTGYKADRDKGMQLILRAGTGNNINPTMYYSWKMPGDTGGDFYRDNIAGCNQTDIPLSPTSPYLMIQEPGDMNGPTIQGVQDLIDLDPTARWDGGPGQPGCNCMVNSKFGGHTSPRIFPIPLYDPVYYADGKANGRNADFKLANVLGFFVDHIDGNQVYGRITPLLGKVTGNGGPAPLNSFATAIRLVQ